LLALHINSHDDTRNLVGHVLVTTAILMLMTISFPVPSSFAS
jgi:hypothetical protein